MKKIVSLDQLIKILNTKYSILNTVLATGCFDILHPEHQKFLRAAKKQGDILIVGLESDKRVKKLKGRNRPVNLWEKRAEKLAAFDAVDFIFPLPEKFNQSKSHLKILQLIKPDILAISENTPHIKEKRKLMQKTGGRLKIVLPYNPKISTTSIINNGLDK